MGVVDHYLTIHQSITDTLDTVHRAMTKARFKDVQVDDRTLTVTGRARRGGQWTRDPISVVLTPQGDSQTGLTVRAWSTAQSLVSLASDPAKKNLQLFIQQIPPHLLLPELTDSGLSRSPQIPRPEQPESLTLTHCDAPLPQGSRFCPRCGTQVAEHI